MIDYFTADLHLKHEKVAKIRGFENSFEHDLKIRESLMSLKRGDRLWILGDISGGRHEEEALELLRDWQGYAGFEIHIIAGNHDSFHPMHRGYFQKRYCLHRDEISSVDTMGTFRHRKEKVMLSHFPYEGDRGTDRYPEYRLKDTGKPLVHGHTHSPNKISFSEKGTLQVHVGLDAWNLKPVSKADITKIIDTYPEGEIPFGVEIVSPYSAF